MKLHLPKLLLVAVLSCSMTYTSNALTGASNVQITQGSISDTTDGTNKLTYQGNRADIENRLNGGKDGGIIDASGYAEFHVTSSTGAFTIYNTDIKANDFYMSGTTRLQNFKSDAPGNAGVPNNGHYIDVEAKNVYLSDSAWVVNNGTETNVKLNIKEKLELKGWANLTRVDVKADEVVISENSRTGNTNISANTISISTTNASGVSLNSLKGYEDADMSVKLTLANDSSLKVAGDVVLEAGSTVAGTLTAKSIVFETSSSTSDTTSVDGANLIADSIEGNVSGATVSAYTEGGTVEISGVDTLKDITLGSSLTMETGKTLTLDGKIDVANIDNTESIDETYLDTEANEGNNGFLRDAGSIVTVVDNVSAGTLTKGNDLEVTMGTRTGELDTTTGEATFMGDVNYATYYINGLDSDDSEHQVKVSEIQDASKDKTERVVMAAGILEADEAIKVSATGGDLIASAMVEIEEQRTRSISMFDSITLTKAGALKGNAATKDFVVDTDDNANVEGDLSILDNGSVTLNNGKVLSVKGSLTLGNGVDVVLTDGDYGVGDKLLSSTGTLTMGDVSLVYNDSTVELELQGNSLVLVSKFKQDKADAVAQGNWGIASASRAFVNTVRGQHSNTGCIANGRGTVWAAAFGAYNDMDGADIDVKGAAVGVDTKVGSCSTVGLAVGYADGEVSPTGLRDVDQEGTYVALYGEHGLKKLSSTSCLSLDWVAAYGNTESEWNGMDWEQDSLQLNTRLNWNKKVTDRLCMSVFGGLEYFASESDTVNGVKTGSIQNLRGEIGVGARYVAWGTPGAAASYDEKGAMVAAAQPGCEKLVLHGEIRYMNDLVRSNPVIRMNGLSGDGENPGRQGLGIEAGATYRIGERWSASANYGFNAMEDSKEHRVNVGASYTF